MSPRLTFICTALLLAGLVTGQSIIKQEWTPEEYPNPQMEAIRCGFQSNYKAYICDPNGILGADVNDINWILADAAYNSTKCPCSTYFCETRSAPKGYKIGVALVRRMKPTRSFDGKLMSPQDQAQQFTNVLKTIRWKMGQCEEDIIIFYSVDDKVLSLYTGRTAGQRLTPYYRDLLTYKVGKRLDQGHVAKALNVLLHDIKIILNCDTGDCSLYEYTDPSGNPGPASVTVSPMATALLVLFTVLCCH